MRNGERKKVLLVDDDEFMRMVLTETLSNKGFEVIACSCPAEALAALKQHHVDAVLSDYQMPQGDGLTLLKQIHGLHPELPLLLMSGCPEAFPDVNPSEAGAVGFVHKTVAASKVGALLFPAISKGHDNE